MAAKSKYSLSLISYGYNEQDLLAEFFERALELLGRTTNDFEIIFVDDGSTDDSWHIAQDFATKHPVIRIFRNDRNRNIAYSFKRGAAQAQKEILFWQTIDWSYDISELEIFIRLLDHFDAVIGVRPVPTRLLSYIPILRSVYRVRTRSDDFLRACISLANYYLLRILYNVNVHDFQNIQFHRTKEFQTYVFSGESSFLAPEAIIKTLERGFRIIEVPIRFCPRQKGVSKGIRPAALWRSLRDVIGNWFAWGWRRRFGGTERDGKVFRLTEPAMLEDEVIILVAPLFKQFR